MAAQSGSIEVRNNSLISILYVTCKDESEASRIARTLIEERLIACANILQSRSIFRWEGALEDGPESIMLCKTTPERERAARTRIRELHSYKVPCIVTLQERAANHDLVAWVYGEVAGIAHQSGRTAED